jgi:hypothetical protein
MTSRRGSEQRRLARGLGVLVVGALLASLAGPGVASADPPEPESDRVVPACTPELVYSFRPGREMDASSVGSGSASNLRYTDANGNPRPPTTADIDWSARGIVNEPDRSTGVHPNISGDLDLAISTAAGERLTFTATCIAAVVGNPFGIVVYANGITRGWPGAQARRTLVHFEVFRGAGAGSAEAYVALIDGTDCRLDFDALLVTDEPYVSGTGTFTGLPSNFVFAETSCSNRFGQPFPALRAPGQLAP